jgi:hypothetical protein
MRRCRCCRSLSCRRTSSVRTRQRPCSLAERSLSFSAYCSAIRSCAHREQNPSQSGAWGRRAHRGHRGSATRRALQRHHKGSRLVGGTAHLVRPVRAGVLRRPGSSASPRGPPSPRERRRRVSEREPATSATALPRGDIPGTRSRRSERGPLWGRGSIEPWARRERWGTHPWRQRRG